MKTKNKILFLTTSNRWFGEKGGEQPKSTRLAEKIAEHVGGDKVEIVDVSKLKIYPCEGNVSTNAGNNCGPKGAVLKDHEKNPSGHHRCWASINNPDDELWKVSKPLLESDCVVFFGSIRWSQMNSIYQRLIERLTWLENRRSTLGEEDLLGKIDAGIIILGHNWNVDKVLKIQKDVISYYGFKVQRDICWGWQFTKDDHDESADTYKKAADYFNEFLNQ
ncbi:MAG: hypothetical protein ACOZBH_04755 [Patescibacteria group bacterium]